jgi:hypothetical protein
MTRENVDLEGLRLVMLWLVSRSKSWGVYKPLPLGMGFMTASVSVELTSFFLMDLSIQEKPRDFTEVFLQDLT